MFKSMFMWGMVVFAGLLAGCAIQEQVPPNAGKVSNSGTTYYVDRSGGNDSNAGTSQETAFKTMARVNICTFSPGDSILFKRGGVWREQLIVPSSGNSGRPISFGAYGTGNKPAINGADLITGWSVHSGSI